FARHGIVETNRIVATPHGQGLAVWRQGVTKEWLALHGDCANLLAGGRIEEAQRVVSLLRNERAIIRGEISPIPGQTVQFSTGCRIPNRDGSFASICDCQASATGQGNLV